MEQVGLLTSFSLCMGREAAPSCWQAAARGPAFRESWGLIGCPEGGEKRQTPAKKWRLEAVVRDAHGSWARIGAVLARPGPDWGGAPVLGCYTSRQPPGLREFLVPRLSGVSSFAKEKCLRERLRLGKVLSADQQCSDCSTKGVESS